MPQCIETKKELHASTTIQSLSFICPKENIELTVPYSSVSISASVQECEVCGSHGTIYFYIKCPVCKVEHEIKVKDW